MTDTSPDTTRFDRQQLLQKVAEFEAELGKLPPGDVATRQLSDDIARLKQHLAEPAPEPSALRDAWQSVRDSAHRTAEGVENQVLRESPTIAEIGRIIGLM